MPGHMLRAECPCGFMSDVSPGSIWVRDHLESRVIAYDPDKNDLVTLEGGEARKRKLRIYPDPYLRFWMFPTTDSVLAAGLDELFPCPSCDNETLRFRFGGWWD